MDMSALPPVHIYSGPGTDSDHGAEHLNRKGFVPGLSQAGVRQHYDEIYEEYEQNLCPGRYNGPQYTADAAARYFTQRQGICIIDVACGTGRVGEELHKRGFTNIVALDPSEKMISLAKKKQVYSEHKLEFFGNGMTTLKNDQYDVLTIAGGMGEGHIPCSAMAEMARVVRPGGFVVITLRKEYLDTVSDYRGRLEHYMEILEQKGCWQRLEALQVPHYAFGKDGMVYVFQVNTEGACQVTLE